jgi:hypothetical protein
MNKLVWDMFTSLLLVELLLMSLMASSCASLNAPARKTSYDRPPGELSHSGSVTLPACQVPMADEQIDPAFRALLESLNYRVHSTNFLRSVRGRVEPERLRTWALKLIRPAKSTGHDSAFHQPAIPEYLADLEAPYVPVVIVNGDPDASKAYVRCVWGGGFGKWGLLIGGKQFHPDEQEFTIRWVDGIYVWEDTH